MNWDIIPIRTFNKKKTKYNGYTIDDLRRMKDFEVESFEASRPKAENVEYCDTDFTKKHHRKVQKITAIINVLEDAAKIRRT